jgi:integrase
MVLLAFRHALRAGELVDLRWSDMEITTGTLYVRRATATAPCLQDITQRWGCAPAPNYRLPGATGKRQNLAARSSGPVH